METSSNESKEDEVKYSVDAERIPLKPRNLINLFIRPRKFFSSQLALGKTPYLLFVALCFGIANVIDRIDKNLIKSEYGSTISGSTEIYVGIAQSWIVFWIAVIIMGAISGFFIWLIGGWWYKIRLIWSGAIDPDKEQARYVYIYSSFVFAGPKFLKTLIYTLLYPSYIAAFRGDEIYSFIIVILVFYSIYVSFLGATTVFELVKWKSRLWFIILPITFYLLIFGLIGFLFAT